MNTKNNIYQNIVNEKYKKLDAIYFYGTRLKYEELYDKIESFSTYLEKKKNIRKGDVVSVILPNSIESVIAIYAINKIGAIASILHPLLPEKAIKKILIETKSNLLILTSNKRKEIEKSIEDKKIIEVRISTFMPLLKKFILSRREEKIKFDSFYDALKIKDRVEYKENEDSFYLGSGGTTGKSKIVVLSSNSIDNLADKAISLLGPKDIRHTMLFALPIFHGFGLALSMHTMLKYGHTINIVSKIDIKYILKSIKKSKTTVLTGVPKIYENFLKSKHFKNSIRSVKYAFVGGDTISKIALEELNNIFSKNSECKRLYEGYGLTETVTVCFVNNDGEYKFLTQGKALDGIEYYLDKDNELYVHSNTMMNRYLNDIEETNNVKVNINNKIYIKTGDICQIDKDNFLIFKERKKRVFRIASINIYPSEIETLVKTIKEIENAVLTQEENNFKNYLRLYVKLKDNKILDKNLYLKIINLIKDNALKYSIPKEIFQIEDIPLTNIGKIDYNNIREQKVIKTVGENND